MPLWYFEKQDLLETPSWRDGIDRDTEARYRREAVRFLQDCGNTLKLKCDTMATGAVFFHRFYMFQSFRKFPRYVMAVCCLFLAGKVEETPKKCRDLMRTAKQLLETRTGPGNWRQYADSFASEDTLRDILTYEKILLQTIKFDLQVEHPYAYLLKYAKSLKCKQPEQQEKLRPMVQMVWAFINDSYCTTLCLQWEPEIIAIALMYLSCKLNQTDINEMLMSSSGTGASRDPATNWWDQFVQDLTVDILEDICHQILDLYQQQKNQPTSGTPATGQAQNKPPSIDNNGANKRKSPPDSLSLTPMSGGTYSNPASPTSAKLQRSFSDHSHPNQHHSHHHHHQPQHSHAPHPPISTNLPPNHIHHQQSHPQHPAFMFPNTQNTYYTPGVAQPVVPPPPPPTTTGSTDPGAFQQHYSYMTQMYPGYPPGYPNMFVPNPQQAPQPALPNTVIPPPTYPPNLYPNQNRYSTGYNGAPAPPLMSSNNFYPSNNSHPATVYGGPSASSAGSSYNGNDHSIVNSSSNNIDQNRAGKPNHIRNNSSSSVRGQ